MTKEHGETLDKLSNKEREHASLLTTHNTTVRDLEEVKKEGTRTAEDLRHVLEETKEILQRTVDENEVVNRALVRPMIG